MELKKLRNYINKLYIYNIIIDFLSIISSIKYEK